MSASGWRYAIALAWVLNTGCAGWSPDYVWVDRAGLEDPRAHYELSQMQAQRLADPEFVITGHRIVPGDGTVLAVRDSSIGIPVLTDQGSFEKVTVYLPKRLGAGDGTIRLEDLPGAFAFLSRGSSAFPGKSGCAGYATGGEIKYSGSTHDAIGITMELHFILSSPAGWKGECAEIAYRAGGSFERKAAEALSPWEGAAGSNVYEESHP